MVIYYWMPNVTVAVAFSVIFQSSKRRVDAAWYLEPNEIGHQEIKQATRENRFLNQVCTQVRT